jgi:hypothetical protein
MFCRKETKTDNETISMGIRITAGVLRRNAKLRTAIADEIARNRYSESKRNRRRALVGEKPVAQGMVDITGPLLIRITRCYTGKRYDDDNLVGGCKQLRDAIAAALSRKGDSEKDGLYWEYRQVAGTEHGVTIEIFRQQPFIGGVRNDERLERD